MEKAHTRAGPTSAFTFKKLHIKRHYAKQVLAPWYVDMKLGCRLNYHNLIYANNQPDISFAALLSIEVKIKELSPPERCVGGAV